ncbi:xanthine dehydrogenase accessory protein XdhC (plasmid) [Deinococcus metallilatus]|uniref:Xanthine dehydrogenase accessory factor n=1 Tax=Deinococcus metallilatus TaxID=1211322 RepID=A0AAJ5F732_9DEIO|nr:xanthine dehydrogenase accessory protein XdhC [Deinococcus metallilatus]MBB5293236.1 xanthine dehydrogenase accessory factor [Deinococcus metallilatus]QBY07023.1 xanthine dehydrogenase accessory protein XdhC [Deinococcus metallilatus]RXJ18034.1 xanthine dehydrogenase accessory protein XdhC [Deinococcus metallilatus]TLK31970.1 xanthine dehydrogenase accessory protein XdhC [Deinococcus metallilatus]GMA15540.1 xanthine dehydrogenase accessory protein XdhC [Deinococcus metallilatus]
MNWLDAVQALSERGEAGVLVTVAAVRGHAPREAGAKMVVGPQQTWDSVGGGNLEATAVERARALLACGAGTPELLTLRLTDRAANEYGRQCCGGEVTLLLEPLRTARPNLAIFGVGHVGLALANILKTLPVNLHLIDSREAQLAPERLAGLEGDAARLHVHHAPIPEMALADLPAGTHLVIVTHDHAEDAALCDAALRRPDLGFIGLIGSKVKWVRFREQLQAVGHSEADLARITTPIGLPGIRGKSPPIIAISVAAQLQQVLEADATSTYSPVSPAPQRTS